MGTESLRIVGCIFAENGPLEGGIESSFSGTGWGAKCDFIRYSYLYPYIFEWRTPNFFESTCPELYAQQCWEWSDAYSWRNDLWKVNYKRVFKKPAGVLMVIWRWHWIKFQWHQLPQLSVISDGFFYPNPCIFEGGPHHLMVIWSGLLAPRCAFWRESLLFSESTRPQVRAQKVWGWSDGYSRRMGP